MRLVIITFATLTLAGCTVPNGSPYSDQLITGSIAPAIVDDDAGLFCEDCEFEEFSEDDLPDH